MRHIYMFLLLILMGTGTAHADRPVPKGIGFQEPATAIMEKLVAFHNGPIMVIITAIVVFVLVLMIYILVRFSEKNNSVPSRTTHNVKLEVIWTVIPIMILLFLVVPSMQLLYFQDEIPEHGLTIKVTGNTWNWEYEYPDFENVESYISNALEKDQAEAAGKPYLMATDAPLIVPVDTNIKVLVTSSNNLHAFGVPAFGIKMDAVPGRINVTWFNVRREGTYYGTCYELCGVQHYKMPIEVEVISQQAFADWVARGGSFVARNEDMKTARVNTVTTDLQWSK